MDYFEFGPFRLEVETRSLYVREGDGVLFVPITPKAFDANRESLCRTRP